MDVEAQPGSRMSFGSSRELNRRIPFENSAQLGTWRDLMKNGYVDTYRFSRVDLECGGQSPAIQCKALVYCCDGY